MIEIFMTNKIRPLAIDIGDQDETTTVYGEFTPKISWDTIIYLCAKFIQKEVSTMEVTMRRRRS